MTPPSPSRLIALALLAAVVAIAGELRFSHADWDSGYQLHPDERGILFVAQDIRLPDSFGQALDAHSSPLNPYRNPDGTLRGFPYGHLTLYLTVASQRGIAALCSILSGCQEIPANTFLGRLVNTADRPLFDQLTYTGRAVSALFDTLSVLAAALLAVELFGSWWAGLAAAALLAGSVLNIQNAHFGTVDVALGCFCTLALWLIIRYAHRRQNGDALLAGAAIGLAAGCKLTGLLLLAPLLAAHLEFHQPIRAVQDIQFLRLISSRSLGLSLGAMLIAFALTNPYALLDAGAFAVNLEPQVAMAFGTAEPVYSLQYVGTWPVLYSGAQLFLWGLGPLLVLAALAGIVWSTWRGLVQRSRADWIVVTWMIIAGIVASCATVKFPRYLLPITPSLAVLAAGFLIMMPGSKWLRAFSVSIVLMTTTANAAAFSNMYDAPHPWIAASKWIYVHIPAGSTLVDEANDDALPLDMALRDGGQIRGLTYQTTRVEPLAEPDNCAKIEQMANTVSGADYLVIASNRNYGPALRLSQRFPLTAVYYQKLFTGELGFILARTWSRYPALMGLTLADDPLANVNHVDIPSRDGSSASIDHGPVDESSTVYDHPLVLLFENRSNLAPTQIAAAILAGTTCNR